MYTLASYNITGVMMMSVSGSNSTDHFNISVVTWAFNGVAWKFSSVEHQTACDCVKLKSLRGRAWMIYEFVISHLLKQGVNVFVPCTSQVCRDEELRMEQTPLKRIAKSTRQFVQTHLYSQVFCCDGTMMVDNYHVNHLQILSVLRQYDLRVYTVERT